MSRRRRAHRRFVAALVMIAGTAVALVSVQLTSAAFTDTAVPRLGATGSLGGAYDIAFLDSGNAIVQGNPTAFTLDTSGSGSIVTLPTISSSVTVRAVTTTAATGPVTLRSYNAYSGTRPPDPGSAAPGADPYDFARYTVTVNGTVLATDLSALAFNTIGVSITGWTQSVAKTVVVGIALPRANANPYLFNRTLVLGLQFTGSSS